MTGTARPRVDVVHIVDRAVLIQVGTVKVARGPLACGTRGEVEIQLVVGEGRFDVVVPSPRRTAHRVVESREHPRILEVRRRVAGGKRSRGFRWAVGSAAAAHVARAAPSEGGGEGEECELTGQRGPAASGRTKCGSRNQPRHRVRSRADTCLARSSWERCSSCLHRSAPSRCDRPESSRHRELL